MTIPSFTESSRPIEYTCEDIGDSHSVTIRECPPLKSVIGDKPAYWYIKRELLLRSYEDIGWSREFVKGLKDNGFKVAYWVGDSESQINGGGWSWVSPRKFDSPEAAFEAYWTWKKEREPCQVAQ